MIFGTACQDSVMIRSNHPGRPRGGGLPGGHRGPGRRRYPPTRPAWSRRRQTFEPRPPPRHFVTDSAWSGSGGGTSRLSPSRLIRTSSADRKRTIPDVSFHAHPNTGLAIYDSYIQGSSTPWTGAEGPVWRHPAGRPIAIADQGRVASGLQTLNATDPAEALQAIYSLPNSDFRDITSGSNGADTAGPGYDEVTGRGRRSSTR